MREYTEKEKEDVFNSNGFNSLYKLTVIHTRIQLIAFDV